jgi:outer membrane protein assembly factor BamE (lipoprotein component of BamABCDE complex)
LGLKSIELRRQGGVAFAAVMALAVAGCNSTDTLTTASRGPGETFVQGHIIDESTLAQVPVGSSREQVMLSFGSPSTTATFDNEVFYYISQTRKRGATFMNKKLVDQRVLAVYFGPDGRVQNISNYGLQEGKVFDFISRTTPTGGRDQNFLMQLVSGIGGKGPVKAPEDVDWDL